MTPKARLFRRIPASRNLLPPAQAEACITGLPAAVGRGDGALGVTRVPLFGGDSFVQAPEDERDAAEALSVRIQCDLRHGEGWCQRPGLRRLVQALGPAAAGAAAV